MQPPVLRTDSIAGVADVAAPSDIVGVQDIQSADLSRICIYRDGIVCLLLKKFLPGPGIQKLLLGKRDSLIYNLIPYPDHFGKMLFPVGFYFDLHIHFSKMFLPIFLFYKYVFYF